MRTFPKPSVYPLPYESHKTLPPLVRKMDIAITWDKLQSFSQDASVISIYIDEVWPSTADDGFLGGIGGIVWIGENVDKHVLRLLPTHLRTADDKMQKIPFEMSNLLSCPRALPFVFPFDNNGEIPKDKYQTLVLNSIIMLLGWILPSRGKTCKVNIYLEQYDGSNLCAGADRTELFEGIQAALAITGSQGRFQRWKMGTVEWVAKEYGYVPYGDLLAYLVHDNKYSRELFQTLQIQRLPGYVPLSLDTLSLLRDLDVSSKEGCFDVMLRLAYGKRFRGCNLFRIVMDTVTKRAKADIDFRNTLLRKLEEAYLAKERDLWVLEALATPILQEFSIDSLDAYPAQKLLRFLIELQDANHNGEPVRILETIKKYESQREKLLPVDPVLCLEVDLNRAVHYHDMFDFESGRQCLDFWMKRDLSLLPADERGKLHSSYGQSCSFLGDYEAAEEEFKNAIQFFKSAGEMFREEVDQTAVYRAMNAIDGDASGDVVRSLVEDALGCPIAEAVTTLAPTTAAPYHHHLLVKFLWTFPEYAEERKNYLAYGKGGKWCEGYQHPWELVLFYRGILCWEEHMSALFEECFAKIDDLYRQMRHGEILDLIYCFIKIGQMIFCYGDNDRGDEILAMLKSLEKTMPKAMRSIAILRNILKNNLENAWAEFLTTLPFNYK